MFAILVLIFAILLYYLYLNNNCKIACAKIIDVANGKSGSALRIPLQDILNNYF